jgi:hypothetical protein
MPWILDKIVGNGCTMSWIPCKILGMGCKGNMERCWASKYWTNEKTGIQMATVFKQTNVVSKNRANYQILCSFCSINTLFPSKGPRTH